MAFLLSPIYFFISGGRHAKTPLFKADTYHRTVTGVRRQTYSQEEVHAKTSEALHLIKVKPLKVIYGKWACRRHKTTTTTQKNTQTYHMAATAAAAEQETSSTEHC